MHVVIMLININQIIPYLKNVIKKQLNIIKYHDAIDGYESN